jgi:hypothetical protein
VKGIPVGASSIDVVARLVERNPEVAEIKLVEYRPAATFQDIEKRKRADFEASLRRRLRHGGKTVRTRTLRREDVSAVALARLATHRGGRTALAVSSRVVLTAGTDGHLPLLDFQCRPTALHLRHVVDAMRMILPGGCVILNSGRSFHCYGFSVVTANEWRQFVGRCLLLDPLVDVRYVGHCLIDGEAALRISAAAEKTHPPLVVATL